MAQIETSNGNRFGDIGILAFSTFLIGFSPALVKVLSQASVGSTAIGFWRNAIGGITLLAIVLIKGKSLKLYKTTALWAVLTGFAFALDLWFWHQAVVYIGSGMSTLLGNTQVFITTVLGYFVFKEKLTARFMLAAAGAVGGITMLVGVWSTGISFTGQYLTGVIFGFCTAATYAMFLMGVKKARLQRDKADPASIMTWVSFSTAVFMAISTLLENQAFLPPTVSPETVFYLIALGIVVQALAWMGITGVLGRIDIHFAALILLLQPVLAFIWGYIFFGESLDIIQVAGAAVTLIAVYLGTISKK